MPRHCAGAVWLGGRDRRGVTVKLGGDRRATVKTGGARRARTADLNTASVALSQLSYGPRQTRASIRIPQPAFKGLYGFNSLTHHARPLPRHTRSPRLIHCGGDVLSGRTHCHSGDSRSPESLSTGTGAKRPARW